MSAPTLTFEDVRPPFTTGFEDDDYMDFWVDNPIAGDELLITSQYIREDELTGGSGGNGFDSGDEIFFLPKASDGDTGADPTLALKYSEQGVSGSCPDGSSAESLEIVQDGSKVTDRSLDLSSGIELERFGTPFEIPESLDGYSIAVYGGGVNFYNGVSHFGLTTIGEQTSEQTPAPNPYSGPLITNINNSNGAYETFPGEELKVYGERLSSVNKVFINNLEGEVVSTSDDHFVMITPEGLTAGSYDLVVESSIGNLRFLGAFVVTEESANRAIATTSCEGAETSWWTQRISDTQAKAYIKCPEVGQKYRILQQTGGSGEYDSVFVKTLTDENDTTQVFNEFGRYIVRTIELEDINRIRITVDDDELWKVRYNR